MRSKEDVAREVLTERLLDDFKSEITGKKVNRVVGINPEDVFFVGKLMSINDEEGKNKAFSSKTFIESISLDFYIDENEIDDAVLHIFPQGDFYYRVYPTVEEQKAALLRSAYEITNKKYEDFATLLNSFNANPSKFDNTEIKLVPVYKKVSVNENDFCLTLKIADILDKEAGYGYVDEQHSINGELASHINGLMARISGEDDFYSYVVNEKVKINQMCSDESVKVFVDKYAKKDVVVNQNWNLYFEITIKKIKDRYLISISMVNNSQLFSGPNLRKGNDKKSIETMFNSGIFVQLSNANFSDIEMDFFADDYKYDRTQKAVGTNCTAEFDEGKNMIQSEHLPVFTQYRYVTNDRLAVEFDSLLGDPIRELKHIERLMESELEGWKKYKSTIWDSLTEKGKASIQNEISEFRLEIQRFHKGIETIENYPIVKKSFVYMNETFKNTNIKYTTWRLFQLVFIVSIIPDIVACDENLMPEDEKKNTTLDAMALLYFPTGGGKTEAFLGVLVFNLFFDRYRGKSAGVTSILRYPLRLLSIAEVQ